MEIHILTVISQGHKLYIILKVFNNVSSTDFTDFCQSHILFHLYICSLIVRIHLKIPLDKRK